MPTRRDFRAITRGVAKAQPAAALMLEIAGLLLLSVP
jgi:hypothetical protein